MWTPVLVLLAATSVIAAPSIDLNLQSINEVQYPSNNGKRFNAYYSDRALANADGGDVPTYILYAQNIINDLANQNDELSQGIAVTGVITTLAEEASGSVGDACAYANLVDAYVKYVETGNAGAVRQALTGHINRLESAIDQIVLLATNPNAAKYSVGPRTGSCANAGRTYAIDAGWNAVFTRAKHFNIGLINEVYCASKRLYDAVSQRSNNVAAGLTAGAVAHITGAFTRAHPYAVNFLRALASGGNPSSAAAELKSSLRGSASLAQL